MAGVRRQDLGSMELKLLGLLAWDFPFSPRIKITPTPLQFQRYLALTLDKRIVKCGLASFARPIEMETQPLEVELLPVPPFRSQELG